MHASSPRRPSECWPTPSGANRVQKSHVCFQQSKANRTYLHGKPKYTYYLSGRLFCAACGYSMFGQTNRQGHRYYRHAHTERRRKCPLEIGNWSVRADALENSVVKEVFMLVGNPAAIERAVKAAIPDCDELMKQKARLDAERAKIGKARDRIIELIIKEALTTKDAEKKLNDLKEREDAILIKLDKISGSLESSFDFERRQQLYVLREDDAIILHDGEGGTYSGGNDVQSYLDLWESPSDLKAFVESAFGEPLDDGPAGAYITPTDEGFSIDLRCRVPGLVPYALS